MARPNNKRIRRIKRGLAARDGAQCFYCGLAFSTLLAATVDHLIPQSVLPGWAQTNLVLACRPCNEAKADQLPQVFLRHRGLVPSKRRRRWATAGVRALACRLVDLTLVQLRRQAATGVVASTR